MAVNRGGLRPPAVRARAAVLLAAVVSAGLLASCADSAGASDSSAEGIWGNTSESSSPSLDFDSGGRFSGTDGCNDLMGSWDQDGSSVELTEVTSTAVGCPDLDDGDMWLSEAASAEVDGETLALFNNDGDPIGTLER